MYTPSQLSYKTIIEEPEVARLVGDHKPIYSMIEEVVDGLKWLLARQPHSGALILGSKTMRLYRSPNYHHFGAPCLTVLYEVEPHAVVLKSIRIISE